MKLQKCVVVVLLMGGLFYTALLPFAFVETLVPGAAVDLSISLLFALLVGFRGSRIKFGRTLPGAFLIFLGYVLLWLLATLVPRPAWELVTPALWFAAACGASLIGQSLGGIPTGIRP